MLWSAAACGQSAGAAGETNPQKVTITGSSLRRLDVETPSPVQVITADDLKKSGYTDLYSVLRNVTANGQGTLSQAFAGAFASGASGVSLRGLTVGATLVLIDGHRMAPYPLGDDGQRSFVDISSIPFEAIEKIEVLKDGASAIYGSDAIAGVVNVILKKTFEGRLFSLDAGTSYKHDGSTVRLAGTWGYGNLDRDGRNTYVSAEFRHQAQIRHIDRPGLLTQRDFTSSGGADLTLGQPTALNNGQPGSRTGYVIDPATNTIAGFMPGCDADRLAAGRCTYENDWAQFQPKTSNLNLVARHSQQLGPDWRATLQASFFESRAEQVYGPGGTFRTGYQGLAFGPGTPPQLLPSLGPTTISATNPSFPAGTGLASGLLVADLPDLGLTVTATDARSMRLVAELQGRLGDWSLNGAFGLTQVLLAVKNYGAVDPAKLQAALDSTSAPYLVGGSNSAAVKDYIAPVLVNRDSSKLRFLQFGAERDLATLPGGPLSLGLGAEAYWRSLYAVAPDAVAQGVVPGNTAFALGQQTVASLRAEMLAPVTPQLETDWAVRYDHYNKSGGKASPKLGFKVLPVPQVGVRGTLSRGFRAPGPAENGTAGLSYFSQAISDPVLCPHPENATAPGNFPSQCNFQPPNQVQTNAALKPETSKSWTLGLLLQPLKGLTASIDFYSVSIDNQIISPNSGDVFVRSSNLTPLPFVQPDGTTQLVVPPVAPIAYHPAPYLNANQTRTRGVDIDLRARRAFDGWGELDSALTISHMVSYDLTVEGVTYHLAGTHGPAVVSAGSGSPRTRVQWVNTWSRAEWQWTGTVNFTSSISATDPSGGAPDCVSGLLYYGVAGLYYADLLNNGVVPRSGMCKVPSFTTFDLYARYAASKNLSLHASALNLFNRAAPADWATGSGGSPYNLTWHQQGAIGRFVSVGLDYRF